MSEIAKQIIGQKYMIERMLVGLLADGHILLEGVPGLAKTLTIKTMASIIDFSFARMQFTPDLLPADIVGTMIFNQKTNEFVPKKGPIFANIVLADEINRAPAKVQSALLEAMQEKQVTIGDKTYLLPLPFLVMATQNPIEQEGTYPLPEAQVDRFMLKIKVDYPSKNEERQIIDLITQDTVVTLQKVITPERLVEARKIVNQVYIDEKIKNYIVDIIDASRNPGKYPGLAKIQEFIEFGASPRASIYLAKAAKAHAFINRRGFVIPEDIKEIGYDVLRHRIIVSYEAEAQEIDSEKIIKILFDEIPVP
ncbi:MAG: ATPase [Candidatus Margulisiibacteriota bacterium]|nr:MAG: ATPase [Candidatus Margulisiibacteriota bacterium]HAR64297.1 ATPase [Candidatus Margulisiibacteriota bacterium]HCT85328.1 ATPase [Candidatus Margulisiibacteriota bacterium]HCY37146.1 ATPase [Candidatus Margulisiibacteriota bacterium]